ncbi:ribosomal protein S10 [Epithele typhae]|uniref:ribosomal protein S10 n=1 Tax=Epithele typhae TaxID=378194 RepID=UPI002008D23F|nr:ribosomal protein S10 [Epithele typhae]KAH9939708.1 ribosomal protein S10 [Epithele typhae]
MLSRPAARLASAARVALRPMATTATPTPSPSSSSSTAISAPISEPKFSASVVHGRSLRPALRHAPTHGVPAASFHLRAHDRARLDAYVHFVAHAAAALGVPLAGAAALPTARSLWTVIRGPFVHKKSQENFERVTHKRALKAFDAHPDVVEVLVQYVERHVPPGVGVRCVRWDRAPVGVGALALEAAVGDVRAVPAREVKALGERIVSEETKAAAAAAAVKEGAVEKSS